MYALCPECEHVNIDPGKGGFIKCSACGAEFKSRPLPEKFKQSRQGAGPPGPGAGGLRSFPPEEGEEGPVRLPPPPQQYYDWSSGRYYPPPAESESILKTIKNFFVLIIGFLTLVGLFCFFAIYVLNLFALGPTLALVLPNMMHASPILFVPTVFPPFLAVIGHVPAGYPAVIYFIFIVFAILYSMYWLLKTEGREALQILKRYGSNLQAPLKSRNSFFLFPQIFLAILFFNVVVVLLFTYFGAPPETPESLSEDTPLWKLMYQLANASVWEEFVTRVLFLGMPLAFIEFGRRNMKRGNQTEWKRFLLGGKMEIGFPEAAFILFSATIFGLAHISGWDYWKFAPTFLSGLAFGYLFVVKGLHVAILLHFAFDYMMIPLELFNNNIILSMVYGLIILFFFALGFIFFIYFGIQVGEFTVDKMKAWRKESSRT
ncbi:MAG: CPBP family intramembrane metalloprotease [Thermoplasmata archaeon]|nr:MAG: CPBP family intramembrane metalloprotease [Thermoplasmata archaeon]